MTTDNPWFIAREGQQHGPLNEKEMQLFVERGHLRPTDLVWQQGFPDWRPATAVFPPKSPAAATGHSAPQPTHPTQGGPASPLNTRPSPAATPAHGGVQTAAQQASSSLSATQTASPSQEFQTTGTPETDPTDELPADAFGTGAYAEPRRGRGRLVATLAVLAVLSGGAYAYWSNGSIVPGFLQSGASSDEAVPVVKAPTETDGTKTAAISKPLNPPAPTPATAPQSARRAEIDQTLQKGELWQYLKGQYPRWYNSVLDNAEKLEEGDAFDEKLAQVLVARLIELRRQNADKVLAASQQDLTNLASTFLDNLKSLANRGAEPCYTFISKGEASPAVIEAMRNPAAKEPIHTQLLATFKASVAGTKSPVSRQAPQKSDYQALTAELAKIGWNKEDIQLFANPKALSEAPPSRVCQMVQDWFTAHLSLDNAETQERLLYETLRPVVSG